MAGFPDDDFGFKTFLSALAEEAGAQPRFDASDDAWIAYFLGIAAEAVRAGACPFPTRSWLFSGMLAVRDVSSDTELRSRFAQNLCKQAERLLEFRSWLRSGCGSGAGNPETWEEFYGNLIRY